MTHSITVGLDIAKNVFHAHGIDKDGEVIFSRKLRRAKVTAFFCKSGSLSDWHRSLWDISSPGACFCANGARGEADAAALREFERAMETLFARGEIEIVDTGPPSKRRSTIVPTESSGLSNRKCQAEFGRCF